MKFVILTICICGCLTSISQIEKIEARVDTSKKPTILQGQKEHVNPDKKINAGIMENKAYRDTTPRLTTVKINEQVKQTFEIRTLRGQIKDPNGNPVPGASVTIKGKGIGQSTDQNGNFSIKIEKNDKINVSIVGYSTLEIDPNQTNVTINGFNIQSNQTITHDVTYSTKETILNIFPVPYPVPSAIYTLQSSSISNARYFYQVDSILKEGLDRCSYDERRYYYIPSGFALVTQMEQIDGNGISLNPPDRWNCKIINDLNSPWDYLKALFNTPRGYYRVLVFLFTDKDLSSNGNFISEDEARKWLNNGISNLPTELRYSAVTNNYMCTLLVYHYEKKPGEDGKMLSPSELSGRLHFQNSHLANYIR